MRKGLALVASCVLAAGSFALADWPNYGGPGRDNVSRETGLPREWPANGPRELWALGVGEGFGGAAISGDEVFVLDRVDGRDTLRCLELDTGKETWSASYDAPGKSGYNGSRTVPTVTEDYVFTCGPFGHLTCFDRKTHEQVWQVNVIEPGSRMPPWAIAQSPVIYKDTIITSGLGRSGGITAWDQKTGEIRWRAKSVPGTAYSSPALLTVAGVEQLVLSQNDGVFSVNPATGETLWSYNGWKCNIPIPFATVVDHDKLLITGGYRAGSVLLQLTNTDGKITPSQIWKIPQGSQIHQPIVLDGAIYINGNTNEGQDNLLCLDAETGKVLWQAKEPKLDRGNIILAGGMLYAMDASGNLLLIKPGKEEFELVSQAKLLQPRDIWAPMAISNGRLVIRDQRQMKAVTVRE